MKNVHIIERPTIEILGVTPYGKSESNYQIECFLASRNIHITSNEYIGLNWYLDGDLVRKGVIDDEDYWSVRKDYKKIVMTTDKKLIKDGVQPIPEDFLKWLVENPTCEEVVVIKEYFWEDTFRGYSLSFPKEEICLLCETNKLIDGVCKECTEALCKPINFIEEEMKCTCKVGEPYNNTCCKVHGNLNDDFENSLSCFKETLNKKYDDTKWDTEKIIDLIQFLSMNEDFNGYSSVSRHTVKHFLKEFNKQ
jgi:hypothetical protein